MSGGGGILCVSVIEAKNVLAADTASDLSFYVKLRLGHNEVKTDTCMNNPAPKFLKDVRLPVASPSTDVLRMDMLQLGPRGDLVVGSAELLVASLVNKGTVVHWFELKAFNQPAGAQLCCVLRYLTASAGRPLTPSYAITTREARERAGTGKTDTLQAPGPTATRALFSDASDKVQAAAAAVAKQPAPAAAAAAASWAPTTPGLTAAPPSRLPRSTEAHDSPTQSGPPAPAAPAAAPSHSTPPAPSLTRRPSATHPVERAASPAGASTSQANGGHAVELPPAAHRQRWLPAPVAAAVGLFLGVAVYMMKRKPALQDACSHNEVSLASSCFNQSSYERYRQRQWRE